MEHEIGVHTLRKLRSPVRPPRGTGRAWARGPNLERSKEMWVLNSVLVQLVSPISMDHLQQETVRTQLTAELLPLRGTFRRFLASL